MDYVWAFLVGGALCVIGQALYTYTKLTAAHVLVLFTITGALLEGIGVYEALQNFAGGGALVPVSGFGASIARGVVQEVEGMGWEGLFTGVFELTGLGIAAAIIFGFFIGSVARNKG